MQYSIAEYRDKLYSEIVKRKKELRRQQKERDIRDGVPPEESRHRHRHRSYRSSRADSGADRGADPERVAADSERIAPAGEEQELREHREQRSSQDREHRHHHRSSKSREERPAVARVEA